jgi:hypothetical protein
MTLAKDAGEALTAVVAAGVELSAARLSEVTHDPWRVLSVAVSQDEAGPFADVHDSVSGDHYGSHFSFPGGSFLVLFSAKTGFMVTSAFTRDLQERVEDMAKREAVVLGEVSNVLLNGLVGHLADAWSLRLIISAPETGIASPRDHLMRAVSRYRESDPLAATVFARLASPRLSSECRIMLFLGRGLVAGLAGPAAAP